MGVQMTKLTFPIDNGDDTGEEAEGHDAADGVPTEGNDVYNNEDDDCGGEVGVEVESKRGKNNKKKKRRLIDSYFNKGATTAPTSSCPTSTIPAVSSSSTNRDMYTDNYMNVDDVDDGSDGGSDNDGHVNGSITGDNALLQSVKDTDKGSSRPETTEPLPPNQAASSTTTSPDSRHKAPFYKTDVPIAQQPCPICAIPFSGSPAAFNMHVNHCLESLSRPSQPHSYLHNSNNIQTKSNPGGLKPTNKKRPSSSVAAFFIPSSKLNSTEKHLQQKQQGSKRIGGSMASDVATDAVTSRPSLDGRESRFVYTIDDDDD